MNYRFRRAQPADVDSIIDIIQERIDWMDRQGLYQWNKTHYMQRYPREYFLQRVMAGEFYLALDEPRWTTSCPMPRARWTTCNPWRC